MNALTTLRYLVFAAFIVCNAVLASVAVWNSSLITSSGRDSRVDIYLVVVGALGLALTFTIVFVELIRRNAFTSRVWFEILWTTLFLLMDLAGASILTSMGPADLCKPPSHSKNSRSSLLPGTCASTRVLMAFTWLCTFVLLIYLVLLVVLTVVNRHNEAIPRIWECTIHNFPPLTAPRMYQSPAPPVLPRFSRNQMTEVPATPAPQRPTTVPSALYSLRSIGLNSQYQIEHFKPPESRRASRGPTSPVASPADYLHRVPSAAGNAHAAMALYPRYISSIYVPPPPAASSQQPQAPPPPQPIQPANHSPPPLGDWPRPDAPLRVKRKLPPTAGLAEGQTGESVSPTRPVGPRTRTGNRPPPLDMTSVRPRRDRDQQG